LLDSLNGGNLDIEIMGVNCVAQVNSSLEGCFLSVENVNLASQVYFSCLMV
jgi:hypothetical protein